MAHKHPVYDTDAHFKINHITRSITTQDDLKTIMQGDHNSERFSFEIPNVIDGHDMKLCNKVLIPDDDVIPEWEQPDSTNGYMTGDKVIFNNHIWESTVDNNVWTPGVYGWVQV